MQNSNLSNDLYNQNAQILPGKFNPSPSRNMPSYQNSYGAIENQNKMRSIPPFQENGMELEVSNNIEGISSKHDNLVQTILKEEEDLIIMHRRHIDEIVEFIKEVLSKILFLGNDDSS